MCLTKLHFKIIIGGLGVRILFSSTVCLNKISLESSSTLYTFRYCLYWSLLCKFNYKDHIGASFWKPLYLRLIFMHFLINMPAVATCLHYRTHYLRFAVMIFPFVARYLLCSLYFRRYFSNTYTAEINTTMSASPLTKLINHISNATQGIRLFT